ncbi:hypothetical protein MGYG_04036 [Nannizzia gypsea CBS 118893]|uniref:Ricin B lectin domain-containing protein n=1 Tax=Arthroderma gypseum (strain ATCC MYA-4604 / CBS 118893) TaxID=535722 RepID=E4UUR6_ARTGP|nr:hypothetical protein MGYG_04036 [Nannizzia gypsea CBS 118893]EFR01033.1 hypothetical protein MGYG_04036 [Nannizzia gypsea CBS 118893]
MHFLYPLLLCTLVSRGTAQVYIDSRTATSNTDSLLEANLEETIILYEYRNTPLSANFTILDDFNHESLAIGTGSAGEIVEVKPNSGQQWQFQQLEDYTHVVRVRDSNKSIHFPTLKDGAVATVSNETATLFEAVIGPNVIYNLNATDANPNDGPLFWTIEPLSATDQRPVLKLRKPALGRARQDFVMKKVPKQSD